MGLLDGLHNLFKAKPEKMQYNNEPIRAKLQGRLSPPDNRYPDCICDLLITCSHFFALEDCYDGRFIEHFAIPLENIFDLQWQPPNAGAKHPSVDPDQFGAPMKVASNFLGGKSNAPGKFGHLCVNYEGEGNQKKTLYFNELEQNADKFLFVWKEWKRQSAGYEP